MKNWLNIDRGEFAGAIKTFHVRRLPDVALLAFENSFLSIESGERLVTMRAVGEWHGRAWFSSNLLKALAAVPPNEDPVVVIYEGGKLRIGTTVVSCEWQLVSKTFIEDVTNPSTIDLLAMSRSSPRSEVHGTDLSRRISEAHLKLAEKVKKAAKVLKDAEISEDDIWALVEERIQDRFETRGD